MIAYNWKTHEEGITPSCFLRSLRSRAITSFLVQLLLEQGLGTECSVRKFAPWHSRAPCSCPRSRLPGADGVHDAPQSQCMTAAHENQCADCCVPQTNALLMWECVQSLRARGASDSWFCKIAMRKRLNFFPGLRPGPQLTAPACRHQQSDVTLAAPP